MPFTLSERSVDTLLDKLSSDDTFRALFQKDPRQALAAVGHDSSTISDQEAAGMQAQALASKEAIQASRDTLRAKLLTEQVCYTPIQLDVTKP